jgi:hypothetical protein
MEQAPTRDGVKKSMVAGIDRIGGQMGTNAWTQERLESYLGMEEGLSVDFKSSRPLVDRNGWPKYFEKLSCHVSAFLNGEGGLLLVGIEEGQRKERPDIATALSSGVPRRTLTAAQFESALCDRIHPSVAGLVIVFPIQVGEQDGQPLLAYVVDVRSGITAYQAADKRYYVRRGYSSEPMEDKDIRLRMLTSHVPRVSVTAWLDVDSMVRKLESQSSVMSGQRWTTDLVVRMTNIGVRSVKGFEVKAVLEPSTNAAKELYESDGFVWRPIERRRRRPASDGQEIPLYPDDHLDLRLGEVEVSGAWSDRDLGLSAFVTCYLDDAPSVTETVDLTTDLKKAVAELERMAGEFLG